MFKYFNKLSWFFLTISTIFLIAESFVAIAETDFIRAMMYRAVYQGADLSTQISPDKTIEDLIGSNNISALYSLGTLNLSLLIFGVLLIGVTFGALGIWMSAKAVSMYSANMRYIAYKKIQSFSFEDVDKFSSSSLVTRITTDVEIANVSLSFASKFIVGGLFSIVFGIIKSSTDYSDWVIMYAYVIPLIFVLMGVVIYFSMPYMKEGQKNIDGINKQVRESILGIRVVKAYNLEQEQRKKFEEPNNKLAKSWNRAFTLLGLLMPILQTIVTGLMVVIYYMTWSNYDNIEAAGELIGFFGILMQVLFSFVIIMVSVAQISRAIPSINRIKEITSYEPTLKYNDDSNAKITDGAIEFKNVSHSFLKDDAHSVLKDINIKIKPKERIGIIGGTGSGKSTLINLLGRLFDPTKGEVYIDGTNVKDFSFNEINSKVAIAMQTATLFSGTIKSNIALGLPTNLSEEQLTQEIIAASKAAEAWEFISKRQDNLESVVEQRGKNFSGGQKQRISIARTIAKKSKVVIFDDSTSALDTVTERKVQANIRHYNDATTIIVAQRISSVEELDRIIVMEKGQVVGFDTHWNLLANNDVYRSIAASQLGTEELNEILKEKGFKLIEKNNNTKGEQHGK